MVYVAGEAVREFSAFGANRNIASISIVIPAYNRGDVLGAAVASAIAQDHAFLELIIVDDGSTEPLTRSALPEDERIRLVRHSQNRGAAAARNTGIEAARGEFIAFLDSDDRWKPSKLTQQMNFMRRLSLEISCTSFEIISVSDLTSPVVAARPYEEVIGILELVWGCYVSPGSTLIARRDLMLACGGYDVRFCRYEDWDLLLRLLDVAQGRLGFLDVPLAAIVLGSDYNTAGAMSGLDQMYNKHEANFRSRDKRLSRQFRSGIAFNKAAVCARAGRPFDMVIAMLRSVLLCPMENWPIKSILAPKLRTLVAHAPSSLR